MSSVLAEDDGESPRSAVVCKTVSMVFGVVVDDPRVVAGGEVVGLAVVRLVVVVVGVSDVDVILSVVVALAVVVLGLDVVGVFVAFSFVDLVVVVVVADSVVVLAVVAVVDDLAAVTGLVLGAAVVVVAEDASSFPPLRFGRNDGRVRARFLILPSRPSTFSTSFFSRFTGTASVVETPAVVAFARFREARLRNLCLRRCAAAESRRLAGGLVVVVLGEAVVFGVRGEVVRSTPGGLRRGFSGATRPPGLLVADSVVVFGPTADDSTRISCVRVGLGFSVVGGCAVFGRGTSNRPGLRLDAILRGAMPIASATTSGAEDDTAVDFSVVVSGSRVFTTGFCALLSTEGDTFDVNTVSEAFETFSVLLSPPLSNSTLGGASSNALASFALSTRTFFRLTITFRSPGSPVCVSSPVAFTRSAALMSERGTARKSRGRPATAGVSSLSPNPRNGSILCSEACASTNSGCRLKWVSFSSARNGCRSDSCRVRSVTSSLTSSRRGVRGDRTLRRRMTLNSAAGSPIDGSRARGWVT